MVPFLRVVRVPSCMQFLGGVRRLFGLTRRNPKRLTILQQAVIP